jgi:RNA polymerase sigma-70 factor (ECF subfamily)
MSAENVTADWPAISDEQVMAGVKAGSANAFGVLYDRYHERAYRIARVVCRDNGRAEEAVQETFTSIWKTRTTYQSEAGNVAPWVLTVARYRAIDIARRNGRDAAHQTTDDILYAVSAPSDVPEQAASNAQTRHVLSLLAQLPEAQREVITLAFYGELSHTEIATHLGLPTGTVKGRMRLGLQRLRADIQR